MSITSSRVSVDSQRRKVNKMKFTSYDLAFKVRSKVYEMLISYDDNLNYEFEEKQIQQALVDLLKESPYEVAYVTKNVFRYDKDNDGVITYEEFTNFCLQQHFGEMAIQRLHKKGIYANGKSRIMSGDEFNKTLLYCFSFLSYKPQLSSLRQIFEDIDQVKKGYITYSQYFTFLKEYFGSQSKSAQAIQVQTVNQSLKRKKIQTVESRELIAKQNIQDLNKSRSESNFENNRKKLIFNETAQKEQQKRKQKIEQELRQKNKRLEETKVQRSANCDKIARLVYHQMKITAMNYDKNEDLKLDSAQTRQLITRHFKLYRNDQQKLLRQINSTPIQYEAFLQQVVENYMCKILQSKLTFPLSKDRFVQQMKANMYFVAAKPSIIMLQNVFTESSLNNLLYKDSFMKLMQRIFKNYEMPRKTRELRKVL